MGFFRLFRYSAHKKRRRQLKTDIRVVVLQDNINSLMTNRNYLDAMRQIKEIWKLKTSPWMYCTSMVNYIECLIRKKMFRDIAVLEREVLHFYKIVLDISARRLMLAAHDVLSISSRPVHAALLSFYSARISLDNDDKKTAMKRTRECIHFIKEATDNLRGDEIATQYLLSLMKELRNYVTAIASKKKIKLHLQSDCIQRCNTLMKEVQQRQRQVNEYTFKTSHPSKRTRRYGTTSKHKRKIHEAKRTLKHSPDPSTLVSDDSISTVVKGSGSQNLD